ncbi:hypothetical protein LJR225_002591 [Phenylobacterium sp. LjRoot225]|uniref:hypothetical protein n=1 Tax=Phenylobacterium sp. LjRoot225 TaxID=3342285 RepID=UPI003ED16ED1
MNRPRLLALTALILVALYALLRLADPLQRWAALVLGGDRVEHMIVAYLIVSLTLVACPRVKLWTPAIVVAGLGAAVELVQAHPAIVGAAQPGDAMANAAGALAATLPMWLAGYRQT